MRDAVEAGAMRDAVGVELVAVFAGATAGVMGAVFVERQDNRPDVAGNIERC